MLKRSIMVLALVLGMLCTSANAVTVIGQAPAAVTPAVTSPNMDVQMSIDGSKLRLGSELTFGSYKNQVISWVVVDISDDVVTMISKELLDVQVYNTSTKKTPWGNSGICDWLNISFLNEAFSRWEFNLMVEKEIDGALCYVAIPSEAEIQRWSSTLGGLSARGTAYARGRGLYVGSKTGNSSYWLRTAATEKHASFVGADSGKVYTKNNPPTSTDNGVRPVIYVKVVR